MTKNLRITLAQLNLTVGDIRNNLNKLMESALIARDKHLADLIVFPELSITGYPPEDLLLRKSFIDASNAALQEFIASINNIYCLISHPLTTQDGLFNACSLVYNGKILGQYAKQYLPNYGVFDECRYFIPGKNPCVINIKDIPVGLVICEDLWRKEPIQQAVAHGARIILSPNASPFEIDKHEQRAVMLKEQATHNKLPIVYVNNVGGQDELVFDGGSMLVNEQGDICQFANFFSENLLSVDIDTAQLQSTPIQLPSQHEKIYQSLVLSVKDYIHKNNIKGVLIGVSGGIDSALTLAIAVDALGKENVKAIIMPSRYTSALSMEEAMTLTKNLSVETRIISIETSYKTFLETLAPDAEEKKLGIAAQNIQARCRGILLMALSNTSGFLVLNTSNRSEMAVGYCTLYGDMAGGFAVLKDIPKTLVYELAAYRNQIAAVIPERTIQRPPSAELAPDQKDEDSLPPYSILDPILAAYLNQGQSAEEIIAQGFEREMVTKVIHLIHQSEYKRRQAPIGPHIDHKSFGKDWRYPITQGFKG